MTDVRVQELLDALQKLGTVERAQNERRYLKSELQHFGVPVPDVRRAVGEVVIQWAVGSSELLEFCALLWEREIHESRLAAIELLVSGRAQLRGEDLEMIESMLRDAWTWALVDPLAIGVAGDLLVREPALVLPGLARWTQDRDFWLQRAALLAHLLAVRQSTPGALERVGGQADALLASKEFFVRKAMGWVLREGPKKTRDAVFNWLLVRKERASRLTLREASKHLSQEQRAELLH